jgi:flagellar motility protein MotE (MotC chaperone)
VIVTRQRKRRSKLGRYLLPLTALAALTVALLWPPSRDAIANGPLKPVWAVGSRVVATVATPLQFAAQQQTITERNQTIRDLNARLEAQRAAAAAGEARVHQLQQQVSALANQPHPTALPAVRVTAARAGASALAAPVGGQAGAASDSDRRAAATWAAMEPEKAAAVVQRLPDEQVVRVLAVMDADSAAQIMNVLPANVAARLNRAAAQVGATANR